MKTRRMIFFSFLSVLYGTRLSADRFFRETLFHHFYPKIDLNAHFNSVFSNLGWFDRKTANRVRFSIIKIKISIIFMHLRSKLTSEICAKIGNQLNNNLTCFNQITTLHIHPHVLHRNAEIICMCVSLQKLRSTTSFYLLKQEQSSRDEFLVKF